MSFYYKFTTERKAKATREDEEIEAAFLKTSTQKATKTR
jgi:hypothetical protein